MRPIDGPGVRRSARPGGKDRGGSGELMRVEVIVVAVAVLIALASLLFARRARTKLEGRVEQISDGLGYSSELASSLEPATRCTSVLTSRSSSAAGTAPSDTGAPAAAATSPSSAGGGGSERVHLCERCGRRHMPPCAQVAEVVIELPEIH